MNSELDNFFEKRDVKPLKIDTTGGRPWKNGLYEFGVTTAKPKKKRDPNKPTPYQLKRIGEGLAQYIFEKAGIQLRKMEEKEAWPGGPHKPVDVDYVNDAHLVKVEAKCWWTKDGKNNFALSRISDNQRRFLNNATRAGWRAFVTVALLDTLPKRKACQTFYIVPWGNWLEVEAALIDRSKGNYKGKSLRVRDLDLLRPYAIGRDGRKWDVKRSIFEL